MRCLTPICGFSALVLAVLAAGCGGGKKKPARVVVTDTGPIRPAAAADEPVNPAFPKHSIEELLAMDYEKLTDAQKAHVLETSLGLLRTPDWRAGHRSLVRIGKPAMTGLVAMVGETDRSENLVGPVPRVARHSVAEVARFVLWDLIKNHSNYRGDLPEADAAAWGDWYARHGGSLVINR